MGNNSIDYLAAKMEHPEFREYYEKNRNKEMELLKQFLFAPEDYSYDED